MNFSTRYGRPNRCLLAPLAAAMFLVAGPALAALVVIKTEKVGTDLYQVLLDKDGALAAATGAQRSAPDGKILILDPN